MGSTISMAPPGDDITHLLTQLDERGQAIVKAWLESTKEAAQELATLKRRVFVKGSEKLPAMANEVRRALNAAEVDALAATMEAGAAEPAGTAGTVDQSNPKRPSDLAASARRKLARKASEKERRKRRRHRLAKLPLIIERREVTVDDLPDGMTLDQFDPIGTDSVGRFEFVKAHLVRVEYVLVRIRHKQEPGIIVQASPPPSPVAGGLYGASVFAQLLVMRFVGGMPIRRVATFFRTQGMHIAPSSLVTMLHRSADLLQGVYILLREQMRGATHVFADETHQPYQKPGAGQTGRGWMWVALCQQSIVYHFSDSRSQIAGQELLGKLVARLMADGYSAYDWIEIEGVRAACWAHVRRYFFDARNDWPEANQILKLITQLYILEAKALELPNRETDEQRRHRRQTTSKPVVDSIFALVASMDGQFSPKSSPAKALGYIGARKEELSRFLEDPVLPLDNNISERALRCVAMSRKQSLFVGPGDNGQSYATLLTVVQTCILHAVDMDAYLTDVLPRLRLLNDRWKPAGANTCEKMAAKNFAELQPEYAALCPAAWQRPEQT